MIRLLLDANLSPITAGFLRKSGFDTKSITEDKLGYLKDLEVVKIARREKRLVVTFDLDFGEIYHARELGKVGIIVLRIRNQTPENINSVLGNFFDSYSDKIEKNRTSLIIIKEDNIRFVR